MTIYDMILVTFGGALVLLLGVGFLLVGTLAGRFYTESRRIPARLD